MLLAGRDVVEGAPDDAHDQHVDEDEAGPGHSPELAIRADIEIPELKLAMTWSLRRNTDPEEVADTAVFLASDLGRGVTGNCLFVDAGMQIMAF